MAPDAARPTGPPEDEAAPAPRWEKDVLVEGDSGARTPKPGERVRVHLIGFLADLPLAPFDDSRARGVAVELLLGRGNFVPGLDAALGSMVVGERARILLPADAAYGPHGNSFLAIPPGAALEYDVELLGVVAEPELWEADFGGKMAAAEWRRSRGAELYAAGHAYAAHDEFLQGQRYLAFMVEAELTADDAAALAAARLRSELNCAASALKLGMERDALKYCDRALALEPINPKALYRRAQAHAALGDMEAARAGAAELERAHPGSVHVAELRALLARREEALDAKRARFYKRIRARGAKSADGAADKPTAAGAPAAAPALAAVDESAALPMLLTERQLYAISALVVGCAALAGYVTSLLLAPAPADGRQPE
jgi:FK506-binding protein 4/5